MSEKEIVVTPPMKEEDVRLGATITESQLKTRQKMVDDLKKEIERLEGEKNKAEENAKAAYQHVVNEISSSKATLQAKEKEVQGLLENTRRDKNFVLEEKGKVVAERNEVRALEQSFKRKLDILTQAVEQAQK